jgi:ABC-type branched-subunit amino acid transport system substrate-binding protein
MKTDPLSRPRHHDLRHRRTLMTAAAAVGALLVTACSSSSSSGTAAPSASTSASTSSSVVASTSASSPTSATASSPSSAAASSPTSATASSPSAGSATAQGITANSITLGFDAITSGPYAPGFVGNDDYFKAWIDATNASGGIAGRQIKVIELDSAANPAQALSNYKTFWEQDHVAAIVEGGITTPDAYVRSKSIPTFTNGAAPEDYAAANATVFPLVGTIEAWAAEAAYFIVKIANKPIKSVGVLTTGTDPEFDSYIKGYWNKLGVTKVDLEPGFPPGGSCSSDVLKWKSLNVDYIDVVATTAGPSCLQAEGQLGWKPALGQGGIGTSQTKVAEQVGAPFDGVTTGSPAVSYLGAPFSSSPTPALTTYVANIKKYVPSAYSGPLFLNAAINSGYYSIAQVVVQAFDGALKASPNLSTVDLVKFVQGMTNVPLPVRLA